MVMRNLQQRVGLAAALGLLLCAFVATGQRTVAEAPVGSEHTCAIGFGGNVKCWGTNFSGQLGDGTNVSHGLPVDVKGLSRDATTIAAGAEHTCAVVAGSVKCWGANLSGQLGDGANANRNVPVAVSGLALPVVYVAAGGSHTCALSTRGSVKCWGANFAGQLGDGTTVNRSLPVDVAGLPSGVTALAAGAEHTCALVAGEVRCWGANFAGQLGDGTNANRDTPTVVATLPYPATAIAAGGSHTCAMLASGQVKCWGSNFSGQLGDGTNTNRNAPVDVVGLSWGVSAVAAGSEHTCALVAGGTRCWGANFSGQLGNATSANHNSPVEVRGLSSGIAAIAAGAEHTCALDLAGAMRCWGSNHSGQLGDGTTVNRSTPVDVAGLPSERPRVRWRWL
jgi:alpha-tubulin suppressor-like RCC1 family protein